MRVTFLGVGEACDETLPNTSIWLVSEEGEGRRSILLDCGFTVPPQYWRVCSDPDDLDAVWISHFHGDHFFGIPALLLRFWEQKRAKPLAIIGQDGIQEKVLQAMELAYPSFLPKLEYPLAFHVATPEKELNVAGFSWKVAPSGHGQSNLSICIGDGRSTVFYSGDGMPTGETLELARGCDLVIHEAFRISGITPGHGSISECIEFARKAGVPKLALVHLQRDERSERYRDILEGIQHSHAPEVCLPEPGDSLSF